MPCETVSTTNVVIGQNTDEKILHSALAELNLNPNKQGQVLYFRGGYFNTDSKQLILEGRNIEQRTALMKQAYSGSVVQAQAKRFGWTLKAGKEKFQYVVTKRSI